MGAIAFVDCRDFVFRAGHDVKAKGMIIRIVAISWCDLATHCLINLDGNLLGVRVGSRGREQVPAICQRGTHSTSIGRGYLAHASGIATKGEICIVPRPDAHLLRYRVLALVCTISFAIAIWSAVLILVDFASG